MKQTYVWKWLILNESGTTYFWRHMSKNFWKVFNCTTVMLSDTAEVQNEASSLKALYLVTPN